MNKKLTTEKKKILHVVVIVYMNNKKYTLQYNIFFKYKTID